MASVTEAKFYLLTVRADGHIPTDVLVEHIAVALQSFKEVKAEVLPRVETITLKGNDMYQEKPHPFDGPVVFDDGPLNDAELTALDPFPLTTRVIDSLKAAKAHDHD